jgi:hypothetical protein
VRTRRRGQAIVEFGVIALLFTALMFAVVDFGLLLNTWLAVSSGSREVARNASVGKKMAFLTNEAQQLSVPSLDTGSGSGFGSSCCGAGSALYLQVDYFPQCVPGPGCTPLLPGQVFLSYGGTLSDGTPGGHPQTNDSVRITLIAQGAQVITPLIRPAFGCFNGSNPRCHVPLSSVTIMRYEGAEF